MSKELEHVEMTNNQMPDTNVPYEDECHHKQTPRSAELQDGLQKRLNRVVGQLNGVKRMIEDNRYCGDVLTQLAAAESAIKRISDMVLKEHLETCVSDRIKAGDESAIDEVMELLRQHNK